MNEKEATCGTCCWGQPNPDMEHSHILCLIEPRIERRQSWQFCKYWAVTRGLLPPEKQ